MSWKTDPVPRYARPEDHPGWAGAEPTPTMDVWFFDLAPGPAWEGFEVDYEGPLRLRCRRRGPRVRLEVWVPPPDDLEPEVAAERWYVSLWVTTAESRSTTVFELAEGCLAEAEVDSADEPIRVGVFVGPVTGTPGT